MGKENVPQGSLFYRLRQWTKEKLVADVPEDISRCEFECSKVECKEDDWKTCKNRLNAMKQAK